VNPPRDETNPEPIGRGSDPHETDIGDRSPSEAVVDASAALLDAEPADLTPLYRTLDPEALDALRSADAETQVTVQFDYEGLVVTVRLPDVVSVAEP